MNTVKTELCEMRWDSTELFEIHIYVVANVKSGLE